MSVSSLWGGGIASFPRLYAAASLKQLAWCAGPLVVRWFSAALCRGLIEARPLRRRGNDRAGRFSAALCRGLIEARRLHPSFPRPLHGFPRLYAAASLKQPARGYRHGGRAGGFPRLYAAASLKLVPGRLHDVHHRPVFSAALCRGLIEALSSSVAKILLDCSFSAALCRGLIEATGSSPRSKSRPIRFSAALCRGLIEALSSSVAKILLDCSFSAALCRGLIEAQSDQGGGRTFPAQVFRGFMPRPH